MTEEDVYPLDPRPLPNGAWWDRAQADAFEQAESVNMQNGKPLPATQRLYRTRHGHWVLHDFANAVYGDRGTWSQITDWEAVTWLFRNGHTKVDGVDYSLTEV